MLVSVPHFGTAPIPGIAPEDYAAPSNATFARGYADTFAADIYGSADTFGACLLASPYSRLFVDVNRRRDDFACTDGIVTSKRGVFRTHSNNGKAIFARPLRRRRAERLLARFYDPYHQALRDLVADMRRRHQRLLLLDAHTASPRRMGDYEVVIGTRGGTTARRDLVDRVGAAVSAAGFEVHEDVRGYAGGHIVRTYGRPGAPGVDAIQLEINAGVLMTTPRHEFIGRITRGEVPQPDEAALERARLCVGAVIGLLAASPT